MSYANSERRNEYAKEYYQAHKEKYSKYLKSWREIHREEALAMQRIEAKTYRDKYPEKEKAHRSLRYAISIGKVIRQPCEMSGCVIAIAEAHHDDYSKPLDVRWLCFKHHREFHTNNQSI